MDQKNLPKQPTGPMMDDLARMVAYFFSGLKGVEHVAIAGPYAQRQATDCLYFVIFCQRSIHDQKNSDMPLIMSATAKKMLSILKKLLAQAGIILDFLIVDDRDGISDWGPQLLESVRQEIAFWKPDSESFCKDAELCNNLLQQNEATILSGYESADGSCIILKTASRVIALDCGKNMRDYAQNDSAAEIAGRIASLAPNSIALSHFHGDHFGSLYEILLKYSDTGQSIPKLICSHATAALIKQFLNTKAKFSDMTIEQNLLNSILVEGTDEVRLIPTQHSVPGSSAILVRTDDRKHVFYTSDFHQIHLPDDLPPIDLMIIDSTKALIDEPRDPAKEAHIRNTVWQLTELAIKDSESNVYIALFSTQIERADWLRNYIFLATGKNPLISNGIYNNLRAYRNVNGKTLHSGAADFRVALITGIWAQGNSEDDHSDLMKISLGTSRFPIKPGDVVILSGLAPSWSQPLMKKIRNMIHRLRGIGLKIIADKSFPKEWEPMIERRSIHQGGHAHFPEIKSLIDAVHPRKLLAFHGSDAARKRVADYATSIGIEAIPDRATEIKF